MNGKLFTKRAVVTGLLTLCLLVSGKAFTADPIVVDYPVPGINTEIDYTHHAPHNYSYAGQLTINAETGEPHSPRDSYVCDFCHIGYGFSLPDFRCVNCHTNSSGGNYSAYSAPEVQVHSAAAIASDPGGVLDRDCGACHTGTYYPAGGDGPHAHRRLPQR